MATSGVLSSDNWILDLSLLKASLETGFIDRGTVDSIVDPGHAEEVFRGLNQFFYWSRRLQASANATVCTITFLGPRGLIKPNVSAVQEALFDTLGPGCIRELNFPENPNFVSFVMKSPEEASIMRNLVVEVSGAIVCHVSVKPPNSFGVRILWAPLFYSCESLAALLSTWCSKADLKFEKASFRNGEVIGTNRASGVITLKEGVSLTDLPHVLRLPDVPNSHVLLVFRDRPPLCLRCRMVGHIRKYCNHVKCRKCGVLHASDDACPLKSYATVVGHPRSSGFSSLPTKEGLVVSLSPLVAETHTVPSVKASSSTIPSLVEDDLSSPRPEVPMGGSASVDDGFQLVSRRVTRSMLRKGHSSKSDVSLVKTGGGGSSSGIFTHLEDEVDFSDVEVMMNADSQDHIPAPTPLVGKIISSSSQVSVISDEEDCSRGGTKRSRFGVALSGPRCTEDGGHDGSQEEIPILGLMGDWAAETDETLPKEDEITPSASNTSGRNGIDSDSSHSTSTEMSATVSKRRFIPVDSSSGDEEDQDEVVVLLDGFPPPTRTKAMASWLNSPKAGRISRHRDRSGQWDGIFFVNFSNKHDAREALRLDDTDFEGHRITTRLGRCSM